MESVRIEKRERIETYESYANGREPRGTLEPGKENNARCVVEAASEIGSFGGGGEANDVIR